MQYETRSMTLDDAKAFVDNMRWFAGLGQITVKSASQRGYMLVTASKAAWSNWVESQPEEQ